MEDSIKFLSEFVTVMVVPINGGLHRKYNKITENKQILFYENMKSIGFWLLAFRSAVNRAFKKTEWDLRRLLKWYSKHESNHKKKN